MRIEDYGLIGDMQSAALVGRDGTADWLCLPRFDSPSCFSALLGDERHGRWRLAPAGDVRASSRRYRAGTLVLESDFETAEGAVRVIDFMPRAGRRPAALDAGRRGPEWPGSDADGASLRPDYASIVPWLESVPDGGHRHRWARRVSAQHGAAARDQRGNDTSGLCCRRGRANGCLTWHRSCTRSRHRLRMPTRRSPVRRRGGVSGAGAAPIKVAIATRC